MRHGRKSVVRCTRLHQAARHATAIKGKREPCREMNPSREGGAESSREEQELEARAPRAYSSAGGLPTRRPCRRLACLAPRPDKGLPDGRCWQRYPHAVQGEAGEAPCTCPAVPCGALRCPVTSRPRAQRPLAAGRGGPGRATAMARPFPEWVMLFAHRLADLEVVIAVRRA